MSSAFAVEGTVRSNPKSSVPITNPYLRLSGSGAKREAERENMVRTREGEEGGGERGMKKIMAEQQQQQESSKHACRKQQSREGGGG